MEKVEKHISELLFEHDCVIVPDFGGFVANYASAKIHPVQHTFIPPSKNIVFNKNLKNNDGLLANQIVTTDSTNYPEALKHINHFVDNTNAQLKKGIKVKLEDVGTLSLDVERNIQFEPSGTNFLLDAFGLPQFHSPAIKRENIVRRKEREFVDKPAVPLGKKKSYAKRIVATAILVPLIIALVWIPLKTDLLKNINYSNLNPFASKEIIKQETTVKPAAKAIVPVMKKDSTIAKVDTAMPLQPVVENNVKPVIIDSTAVSKEKATNLDLKYHLVAGCFQIENNAINFVATLKEQNISASIIGKNNRNLFVVSCGDYATSKDANEELANLRKRVANVWLYKN